MKKDSIVDYLGVAAFKIIGAVVRLLPLCAVTFVGKLIGRLMYYVDYRRRAVAYSNLKFALGRKYRPGQLSRIIKDFYVNFGQNIIEIFLLPKVGKRYLDRFVTLEGKSHIDQAFKKGKGVILLGVHAGSWELSNLVCANLGFPFVLLVRDQRHPRIDALLNKYRQQEGCKVLQRENQMRGLIEALKNNEAVGMTADQGGKNGTLVSFFGKTASMPSGAIRLALKYGAVILPAYYTRTRGAYQKIIIEKPFEVSSTGDDERDAKENLERLIPVFERLISEYPQEYFWAYKIWKYSSQRNILILSDGKAGHLRQSQAIAGIIKEHFAAKGVKSDISLLEIRFKSKFSGRLFSLSSKKTLSPESYNSLIHAAADIVISAGSGLAAVNHLVSAENSAKSIVVMRPSLISLNKFGLAVIPRHDRPGRGKNIVVTDGALNLINREYLEGEGEKLSRAYGIKPFSKETIGLGLLIGGDTKNFRLAEEDVSEAINQIKSIAGNNNAFILATTSRRTSSGIEGLIKKELKDCVHTGALIIASENNPSFAVGGILGLSSIIITSPESISMISEAVASGKYVIVFDSLRLDKKHRRFLDFFASKKYIYLARPGELGK
ncbi:MAG: hypothetical protein FJZ15_05795, partial [Candidatus Omnitrophica bacterium]|nr:hypothetical protein [Candidatus Omnitrophota bacterium]